MSYSKVDKIIEIINCNLDKDDIRELIKRLREQEDITEIGKRNELIAEYFCKGQERIL